jgi:hypothetical protein
MPPFVLYQGCLAVLAAIDIIFRAREASRIAAVSLPDP